MANEVVMPRLGWTMETGRVVEWLKRDGDRVEAGEAIFAVEADKGVSDVEALDAGTLRIPPDSPLGIEVPVGTTLAYIVPPGAPSPLPSAAPQPLAGSAATPSPTPERATDLPRRTEVPDGLPPISPRARRRAEELGVTWQSLAGSGCTGRIIERDVLAASASSTAPRPRAAPAVRRMAAERGVALERALASGPAGRVTRSDVRAAATPPTRNGDAADGGPEPMGPTRRLISRRMAESARTAAPVTLTTEADATELVRIRARLKEDVGVGTEPVPSLTDLVVRLVALALVEHPDLNASLEGEAVVRHARVHVGIAVDTERGLVVPVVRGADRRSVGSIAAESARLIASAREGRLPLDDTRGGTFTVTNLGMFEIDSFTPIVNLPECAILGLGRAVPRPVVIDEATEAIAVRKIMALSLTFDHRVVDGGPAARFLQRVKGLIERPYAALMR